MVFLDIQSVLDKILNDMMFPDWSSAADSFPDRGKTNGSFFGSKLLCVSTGVSSRQ